VLQKIDPREIPISSGDAPRYIDPKAHDAEVEQLKRGLFNSNLTLNIVVFNL